MLQECHFPGSLSVFILNLFLWFLDCLDLHGCSSVFGKHRLPQTSVLLRALPCLVSCPCGSDLQGFIFPVPAVSPPQQFPYADSHLTRADLLLVLLLCFFLTLSFNSLCPFFIPGVTNSSIYPAISPSHFQALSSVLPEGIPAHPTPSLSILFPSQSLLTLLF